MKKQRFTVTLRDGQSTVPAYPVGGFGLQLKEHQHMMSDYEGLKIVKRHVWCLIEEVSGLAVGANFFTWLCASELALELSQHKLLGEDVDRPTILKIINHYRAWDTILSETYPLLVEGMEEWGQDMTPVITPIKSVPHPLTADNLYSVVPGLSSERLRALRDQNKPN